MKRLKERTGRTMLLLIVCLFMFSFVSSLDITASIKEYNESDQLISLKDLYEKPVADYKLLSNECDEQMRFCNATIKTFFYEKGRLYDFLNFKQVLGNASFFTSVRNYQIYRFSKGEKLNVSDLVCVDNKTCVEKISQIDSPEWSIYYGETFLPGEHTFLIKAEKRPSFVIDWILTAFNQPLIEWAIWGNISEGDQAEVLIQSPINNTEGLNPRNISCFANVTNGAYLTNMSVLLNGTINQTFLSLNSTTNNSLGNVYASGSYTTGPRGAIVSFKDSGIYAINVSRYNSTIVDNRLHLFNSSNYELTYVNYTGNYAYLQYAFVKDVLYYLVTTLDGGTNRNEYYRASFSYPVTSTDFSFIQGAYCNAGACYQDTNFAHYGVYNVTTFKRLSSTNQSFNVSHSLTNYSKCQACDTDGVCGNSSELTLLVDFPQINVTSPISSVSDSEIVINLTANDTSYIDDCYFNITRGASTEKENTFLTNFTAIEYNYSYTLSGEATYVLNVVCNDTFGHSNFTSLTFTYSSTPVVFSGGGGGVASLFPSTTKSLYDEMFYFRVFALLSFFVFLLERVSRK